MIRLSYLGIFALTLALGASGQNTSRAVKRRQREALATQQDIQALRELIEKQQNQIEMQNQQIQELQGELRQKFDSLEQANSNGQQLRTSTEEALASAAQAQQSAEQAEQVATHASSATEEVKTSFAKQQQANAKHLQNMEARLKQIGPFNFSGDLRLRAEPFFGGPADQSQVRNRMRFRLRVNASAKLNDDINAGLTLASGDINDPISANQTTNQFYTRKAIAIDKAFVNYNPHQFKPLTLTGGKFAYPWYNTELTWDRDLNPEGVAQTLAFDLNSPVLKRIALVGFELPFAEVAGTSVNNKSIVQSAVYGGQLQTTWQFAPWLKFGAYSGFYNYHNADPIALAIAKANLKNPTTPLSGALPLVATGFQNSVLITTQSGIVTVNGTPISTGVKTVTDSQFASQFGLFDNLARFDIQTPSKRWPITLIGDYVQNTQACANLKNLRPAPASTNTATYSQAFSTPCVANQRRAYWAEARFGRAQDKGDWQFAYTRMFIEREAVMSAFNASDIRQGSNTSQHRAEILFQALPSLQLAFTGFLGRPLNLGSSNPPEDMLQRYQFDLIYKF